MTKDVLFNARLIGVEELLLTQPLSLLSPKGPRPSPNAGDFPSNLVIETLRQRRSSFVLNISRRGLPMNANGNTSQCALTF